MQFHISTLVIQWPSHHLHEIKKWTTSEHLNHLKNIHFNQCFSQSRTKRRTGLKEEVEILLWSEFSPKETKENILLLLGKSIWTLASRPKSCTKEHPEHLSLSFLSPMQVLVTDTPALSWSPSCQLRLQSKCPCPPNHFNELKIHPSLWSFRG